MVGLRVVGRILVLEEKYVFEGMSDSDLYVCSPAKLDCRRGEKERLEQGRANRGVSVEPFLIRRPAQHRIGSVERSRESFRLQ